MYDTNSRSFMQYSQASNKADLKRAEMMSLG